MFLVFFQSYLIEGNCFERMRFLVGLHYIREYISKNYELNDITKKIFEITTIKFPKTCNNN